MEKGAEGEFLMQYLFKMITRNLDLAVLPDEPAFAQQAPIFDRNTIKADQCSKS